MPQRVTLAGLSSYMGTEKENPPLTYQGRNRLRLKDKVAQVDLRTKVTKRLPIPRPLRPLGTGTTLH